MIQKVNLNMRRIRSCPELRMSSPISPKSIRREILIGTAMAVSTFIISGHHHTIPTKSDIESSISSEIINSLTNIYYCENTKSVRAYKLKKKYLFALMISLPFIVRFLSFVIVVFCL